MCGLPKVYTISQYLTSYSKLYLKILFREKLRHTHPTGLYLYLYQVTRERRNYFIIEGNDYELKVVIVSLDSMHIIWGEVEQFGNCPNHFPPPTPPPLSD